MSGEISGTIVSSSELSSLLNSSSEDNDFSDKSVLSNEELNKMALVTGAEVEIDGSIDPLMLKSSPGNGDPISPGPGQNSGELISPGVEVNTGSSPISRNKVGGLDHSLITKPTTNILSAAKAAAMKSQDVRVDNWANYCLQRLQVMYDRGDFCDLTLQFGDGQTLKVHRVVVNICTEYFAHLEKIFGLTDGMLVLPKDVEYSTMVTIVKFFYTGKLEVKGPQFNDIYRTVKMMNILILTKLLEAHARKPEVIKKEVKPIVFKQAADVMRNAPKMPVHMHQGTVQPGTTIKLAAPGSVVTAKSLGGRPLPPGAKTKTVLARVQPQTLKYSPQQFQNKMGQKKLPIWKERKYSPVTNSETIAQEKWPIRDEPAKPTRFEWPDPDDLEDPFAEIAATPPVVEKPKPINMARKAEDIFDAVKSQTQGVKRPSEALGTGSGNNKVSDGDGSPTAKMPRMEGRTPMKEDRTSFMEDSSVSLGNQSENLPVSDVNLTEETVEEVVSTTENETYEQELAQVSHQEGHTEQDPLAAFDVPSVLIETTVSSSPSTSVPVSKPSTSRSSSFASSTPKRPSLKLPGAASVSTTQKVEKSVRFAPEVEKENKTKNASSTVSAANTVVVAKTGEKSTATNHSRIISEVLKKYPDLVKDNKNIKLKIVQKESDLPTSGIPTKDGKSKVSYIVLKSTSAPDALGTVVPKKSVTTNKAFWDSDKSTKKSPSGAENVTGPWLCNACGTEDIPKEFDTYYTYRRHLVDVHAERIDARICEYCGQKASKRNLLLYHLYTKHGVNPPKNCVFPHCDRCDYVALSESLLNKHKQSHDINKEYPCTICNASFKSSAALQEHMIANLHRNKETKVYDCPYCRKPFVRNINLKAHIRSVHKDIARPEEMDDPRLPAEDGIVSRGVGSMQAGLRKRPFPSILAGTRLASGSVITENSDELAPIEGFVRVAADGQGFEILPGVDPNMPVPVLVPSSEAEALSNVASSISASLGLDSGQHAEFITGVQADGTQAVFIMDSSQSAVEVDLSNVGVGMTADGSMIFEGDGTGSTDQFIVQDLHGNQFRKITGLDETGKQVIFFQLQDENGQVQLAPAILDDSVVRYEEAPADGTPAQYDFETGQPTFSVQNDHMYLDPQKCSVYVSSEGVTLPVTMSSDVVAGQPGQVLISNLSSGLPPGHVLEFHPSNAVASGHDGTVLTSETILNQGEVQIHSLDAEHALLQAQGQVDQMGHVGVVIEQGQVRLVHEEVKDDESVNASMSTIQTEVSEVAVEDVRTLEEAAPEQTSESVTSGLHLDETHTLTDVAENVTESQTSEGPPVEEEQPPDSLPSFSETEAHEKLNEEPSEPSLATEQPNDTVVFEHNSSMQEPMPMEVSEQISSTEVANEEYTGPGLAPHDVDMGSRDDNMESENEDLQIADPAVDSEIQENPVSHNDEESSSLNYETESQELMVEDASVDIA